MTALNPVIDTMKRSTPYIAVMQGRLSPPENGLHQSFPQGNWRNEFALAAQAGLSGIEWLFDVYVDEANPIASAHGVDEIRELSERAGVSVHSLCADYFKDRPFLRTTNADKAEKTQKLNWLLSRCNAAGIRRIVLPFLDQSRIESEDDFIEAVSVLRTVLPAAEEHNVEIHLETSLAPQRLKLLLEECSHQFLRVTYDSGNSCSLGYLIHEEFAAYGDRVGSVHVKDRKRGAGTVPLGTGDTDLPAFFRTLAARCYGGEYVMEIARSEPGQELRWITKHRAWVQRQIEVASERAGAE